jgi:hypothetical protein
MSMSHGDADDGGGLPADTASARWAGYKVVGGGNGYDLLERDGVRTIQCRKCRQLSHDPEHVLNPFCPNCHENLT